MRLANQDRPIGIARSVAIDLTAPGNSKDALKASGRHPNVSRNSTMRECSPEQFSNRSKLSANSHGAPQSEFQQCESGTAKAEKSPTFCGTKAGGRVAEHSIRREENGAYFNKMKANNW